MGFDTIRTKRFDYDVALSFSGDDRTLVEEVASELVKCDIRVFYDEFFADQLWGKDLYQHLQTVYRDKAKFWVVFVSNSYAKKVWPKHELRQAQERALFSETEYILPVIVDDIVLPGLNRTTGYVDARDQSAFFICALLLRKLGVFNEKTTDLSKIRLAKQRSPRRKLVTYNGSEVIHSTPARIQNAQAFRHVSYDASVSRIRYGDEFLPRHRMKRAIAPIAVCESLPPWVPAFAGKADLARGARF